MTIAYVTIEGLNRYAEGASSFVGYSRELHTAKHDIRIEGYKSSVLKDYDGVKELLFEKI